MIFSQGWIAKVNVKTVHTRVDTKANCAKAVRGTANRELQRGTTKEK